MDLPQKFENENPTWVQLNSKCLYEFELFREYWKICHLFGCHEFMQCSNKWCTGFIKNWSWENGVWICPIQHPHGDWWGIINLRWKSASKGSWRVGACSWCCPFLCCWRSRKTLPSKKKVPQRLCSCLKQTMKHLHHELLKLANGWSFFVKMQCSKYTHLVCMIHCKILMNNFIITTITSSSGTVQILVNLVDNAMKVIRSVNFSFSLKFEMS